MKKSGSKRAKICTENKNIGTPCLHNQSPKEKSLIFYLTVTAISKSAHLIVRDKVRDFAIFCLDEDQETHPSHFDLDQNFPGIDRLDFRTELASRRAFAIGYNSWEKFERFERARKKVIDNLTPEKKARAENSLMAPEEDFDTAFLPKRKSLSIGRLDSDPPKKDDTNWKHRITGWHGISGAMIACLNKSSTLDAKVQVLGLCKTTAQPLHHE